MSMGHAANHITVISEENLSALCPEAFFAFNATIARLNLEEDEAFYFLNDEDTLDIDEEDIETLTDAWKALQQDFEDKTKMPNGKHLELYCGYHNPESGDIYDDIEGAFFSVDGVYERSQAGEVFQHILIDVGFVTFG